MNDEMMKAKTRCIDARLSEIGATPLRLRTDEIDNAVQVIAASEKHNFGNAAAALDVAYSSAWKAFFAERDAMLAAPQPAPQQPITDEDIRRVFMAHGFVVKPGCDDLKPYVIQAGLALVELAQAAGELAENVATGDADVTALKPPGVKMRRVSPAAPANAKLIAAAPELLAALQGILSCVSVRIDDPRIAAFDAAREAIANSTGEQK